MDNVPILIRPETFCKVFTAEARVFRYSFFHPLSLQLSSVGLILIGSQTLLHGQFCHGRECRLSSLITPLPYGVQEISNAHVHQVAYISIWELTCLTNYSLWDVRGWKDV
jgi:hypothetical protein